MACSISRIARTTCASYVLNSSRVDASIAVAVSAYLILRNANVAAHRAAMSTKAVNGNKTCGSETRVNLWRYELADMLRLVCKEVLRRIRIVEGATLLFSTHNSPANAARQEKVSPPPPFSSRTVAAILMAMLATLGWTAELQAEDERENPSAYSFSGFGTLGAVRSSEDRADFTANGLRPNGPGYSRTWSFDVDSRIAAQASADVSSRLTAMAQVVSEQLYDNTYRPRIEWANLKYRVNDDLSVRVGRTVLPVFFVSDYRKVGYANPWVRPPVELYTLIPLTNTDGMDVTYRRNTGAVTHNLATLYGRSETHVPMLGTVDAKHTWAISDTIEWGPATFYLFYLRSKVTVGALRPFFGAFREFGAPGVALAEKYELENRSVSYRGVAASYNPEHWFAMGEWGRSRLGPFLGDATAWYVSFGRQVWRVTPYVTYAKVGVDSSRSDPGLDLSTLPPFAIEGAASLNTALNAQLASFTIQNSTTVGVRWDFARNLAFKAQYDRVDVGAGSPGTQINLQPGFRPGGSFDLFSLSIDFVW
jgi:hypothetical protein